MNAFGLYRNDDIEHLLRHTNEQHVEPFLAIDTTVVELMDLTSEKSHRHLTIGMPPITPTKIELEVEELF